MTSQITHSTGLSSSPFSRKEYLVLSAKLEQKAKEKAVQLGIDWDACMIGTRHLHTPERQLLTILKYGLFDEGFYLSAYPDIAVTVSEPAWHYVNDGDREGRCPNPIFNPSFYRAHFQGDGLQSVCALYHYAVLGEAMGLGVSSAFSPDRYLASNPQLQPWLDKPLTHYLHLGRPHRLAINQYLRLGSGQQINVHKARNPIIPPTVDPENGINIIGPLDKVSGLGVSARGYLDGLQAAGMKSLGTHARQHEFARQTSAKAYSLLPPYKEGAAINLVHMNGDTLPIMMKGEGAGFLNNKYNIAVWYWELPTLRPEWQVSMRYFHEFWAPTPFILRALKQSTGKPVHLVPPYLAYLSRIERQRKDRDDGVRFVYCFDANSILERKNPVALLNAFLNAFPPGSDNDELQLIFKVTYPDRTIPEVNEIYLAASQDARIKIIDHLLPDAELHSLIASATAYVSPHRSEGLGLTVIEAMASGVPVVATPFGGVDTFVTADAAFPIAYTYRELESDYIPYPRGFVWADPDVDSLTKQLSLVRDNPDEADRRAQVARQRVLDFFCSPSLTQTYLTELNRIAHLS